MAFDPMADLSTGAAIEFDTETDMDTVPVVNEWTPFVGDSVAPYIPAWALECGCGNTGFVTGTVTEAAKTLAKAGWLVFSTRVLCPSCARDDA